jgi:hypothetical protein
MNRKLLTLNYIVSYNQIQINLIRQKNNNKIIILENNKMKLIK